jgi:glutamate-ammonia-ligase adenylyltransferase
MAAMLNDPTGEGYVFRTDLRLRPDPAVTPVCMAMEAAMRYYESLGRTWERAAYIKARPAAGDITAGNGFLTALTPFIWRRQLDFAAIQDAHDMRLRIRQHKGLGGAIQLEGHNMKLGRGGIREIEFFTQTRQIIAGGRDPALRVRGTVEGLAVLATKGWVTEAAAQTLTSHYQWHREVEHRLQMVNDAQTHILPKSPEGMQRIACFMGLPLDTFRTLLTERLTEVHDVTEGFFAPDAAGTADLGEFDTEVITRWRSYPALRSERAIEVFNRLKPEILARLHRAAKPHEALLAFDGFLAGLPAGVQLFSLFEANPQLIDLLVDIVGTSPALAAHLSRHSGVFDAVIGGDFFAPWPGSDALTSELAHQLSRESDYEQKLDAARRWAKEWHFRIGVHHLRGLMDADSAAQQYADLAQASIAAILPEVTAHFAAKHGPPPGRGAIVLAMGSLGAERLNAASDLDLIMIYDADGVDMSDGKRPLSSRPYYARLTQALVTAITAPMAEGRLYEIDMRLRPSGSQGPVATSLQSFRDYQQNKAWVWEHLALTRARVIAGDPGLAQEVETFRAALITEKSRTDKVLQEVATMRTRIAAAKSPSGPWDVKLGPGHLQDIELMAQAGTLLAGNPERSVAEGIAAGVANGWLGDADGAALLRAYRICWQVQLTTKLLTDRPLDTDHIGIGGCAMLLRETAQSDLGALQSELADASAAAARVIDKALAGVTEETSDER